MSDAQEGHTVDLARGAFAADAGMGQTTYDHVGIVMSKSPEGDAVAEMLRGRPGVEILENATLWDIRGHERLIIVFAELEEVLGTEVDGYTIQVEMTTHYGRMVVTDDALMLFSDPSEAFEHLM